MSALRSLENNLNELFVKQAPPLPSNAKKALAQYLPWISLILGLLTLYTVYTVWHWAHLANNLINYANSISATYGGPFIAPNRLTFGIWLGLAVLLVEALLYILAFNNLQARKKPGWDFLFYAMLINIVYGIVVLFTDYGSLGNLMWTVIGSGLGLYLLFQIRGNYKTAGGKAAKASKNTKKA